MKTIENCKLQNANCKLTDERREPCIATQVSILNSQFSICSSPSRRRAFTLVELLIVITIIALLASVALAALQKTKEVAKGDATKATIAKLNDLVMRQYESYMTRRVPLNLSGMTPAAAAAARLHALRDLMRMEMPERWSDVSSLPISGIQPPALQLIYQAKYKAKGGGTANSTIGTDHAGAKCLYMWVMTAIPEARSMFTGAEIGAPDGDGMNMFLDGWGKPICWLRWAPGYSPNSDIQIADPQKHHDPMDYRNADPSGYQLFPLIYAGVVGSSNGTDDYGISVGPPSSSPTTPSVPPTVTPCTSNSTVGAVSMRHRSRIQQSPHRREVIPCESAESCLQDPIVLCSFSGCWR